MPKKRKQNLFVLCSILALVSVLLVGYGGSILPVASPVGSEVGLRTADDSTDGNTEVAFTDYEDGFLSAREQNLPILICFTVPKCPYCHQLLTKTFLDSDVRKIWGGFVHIQVNTEERPDLCELYGVKGYPTVQILSPTGTQLKRLEGEDALSADHLAFQMQITVNSLAANASFELKK